MDTLAIIATVCATFIFLIWFIWNVRKENRKVLKRQEDVLIKIEEGQKEGLKALKEGQNKLEKILYKLDLEEREGLKTLAEISKKTEEGKTKGS